MKPDFMAVKLFLRQYSATLFICSVFFVALMPWYFFWGMTVYFLIITSGLPILVILGCFIVKISLVFKRKRSGKEFAIQVVLVCATFFVAIPLAHLENGYVEQHKLESLKEKIELYKNQQGILPARLEEMGISSQDKRIHYKLNQNRAPRLTYSSNSICLCLYVYDFQKHVWYTKNYNFSSVNESEYWNDGNMAD